MPAKKRTSTETQSAAPQTQSVYAAIETEARFLTSYPDFAAAYQDALRRHSRNETQASGEAVLQSGRTCDQCRKQVAELSRLVRLHLPEAYAKLKIVPSPAHWHMQQRFDWDSLLIELRTIEAAAAVRAAGPPHQDFDDEPVTPAKVADRLGIPADDRKAREAVSKRLERWRTKNKDGGWIEVADPKPREPRYLYPIRTIWPIVDDMKPSG